MPEMERSGSSSDIIIDVPEDLEGLIEGELTAIYYALLAYKDLHPAMNRVSKEMLELSLIHI